MKEDVAPARVNLAEAWKPWKPDTGQPWNLKWAGHLLRRAVFSPSWEELQLALKDGPEATVDRLLAGGEEADDFDALADDAARGLAVSTRNDTVLEYQALWIYRMLQTPAPLRERMTLFWHNHFATGVSKVRQPGLMQQQNAIIRKHALGKFAPFLLEMSRDPAMLIWLDSNSNRKGKANENYAREVMELFSLGVGNYTEKDVQEAARAFTGWHTAGGQFIFNERLHDDAEKTILGQKGKWDGGDVIRIIHQQPAAGRFLARKLYRYFVSENDTPADALIEPLAEQIRKSDYDMKAAVKMVLRSKIFFSPQAYRQRVKSPVELIVGLVRSLGGMETSPSAIANLLEGMGQALYNPPTVKGWDGGKAWLNSATLLARHNAAWSLVGGENEQFKRRVDAAVLAERHGGEEPSKQVAFLLDLFLQGDVSRKAAPKLLAYLKESDPKGPEREKRLREMAHTILVLPEYQLA
jgi:uncharacterized protein (DUF1800 family)